MLPYKIGQTVIIDPNVSQCTSMFGPIPKILYKRIGTIIETKYIIIKKCMTYKVEFDDPDYKEEYFWFAEKELT